MGVYDRWFEPPAADLAKINARLQPLPARLSTWIRRAGDALAHEDLQVAQALLGDALAASPGQPDVLRLYGLLLAKVGNLRAAFANFEAALRAAPDDAFGYWQYAQVCEQAGDLAAALQLREHAVQRLPDSALAWADLGEHWFRHGQPERAVEALQHAVRIAPEHAPAHLKLGDALVACGHVEEGAAAIRRSIALVPEFGAAWLDLADIKTVVPTDAEVALMRGLLQGTGIDSGERTAIGFALARACEAQGHYAEACALLLEANARRRQELPPWDAADFSARVVRAEQVFAAPHAVADDPALGAQAIFVVGLPRSGTTLVEQILASHPEVQGLGERGELAQVLTEESARRRQRYPDWVPDASAGDWQRLGERYLELIAPLRDGRNRFVDKMPNNWRAIGAIRAMLPGARVVACRRDPMENCWSCFKQYFASGWEFTCDMQQLALFWKAFNRAANWWGAHAADAVHELDYDALARDPEPRIRKLLAFCGLPFDAACLAPHLTRRKVDTLSSTQVQQPIHASPQTAAAYGALLNPLRAALGMPLLAAPAQD